MIAQIDPHHSDRGLNPGRFRGLADTGKAMKRVTFLGLAVFLAGCGGSGPREADRVVVMRSAPVAFGPISKACLQSGRDGRTRELCGCIQAAADKTLTNSQQRRAVSFYSDPHRAQEIRQSKRSADEEFWDAYVRYGKLAEQLCT